MFINLITRLHLENVQVTQLVGLPAVLPTLTNLILPSRIQLYFRIDLLFPNFLLEIQ